MTYVSMMTKGLAVSLEDAIKRRFGEFLIQKMLLLQPSLCLKWVELQSKKDHYMQMLIDEMRLCIEADDSDEAVESVVDSAEQYRATKKDFYEFDSDEEHTS